MPKTEIILTHNIVGLGAESDQVKVAAGYARNYLFPQGLAIPLTSANKRRIEVLRQRRAEREAHELNSMSELARSVSKLIAVVTVKTGEDGKMFGSVTNGTIADQLKHQFDISLDKKKIHLEKPIRTLGEHEVELRLHTDVTAMLKVRVESSTPPPQAEPSTPDAKPAEKGHSKTEKRGRRPGATGQGEPVAQQVEKPAKSEKPAKGEKPAKAEKSAKTEKHSKADKA